MSFPNDDDTAHVEININGKWIDISADVLGEGVSAISINRHAKERGPSNANTSPCTASMTIATADGKYSPRNAAGPYYGYIGNNTPLRVLVTPHWSSGPGMDDSDTFTRTVASGWDTSNGGNAYSPWYYGGTYSATDWSVNGTQGIHSVPAAYAYRMSSIPALSLADVDIQATVDTTVTGVLGAPIEIGGLIARLNTTLWTFYFARLEIDQWGTCTAKVFAAATEIASATADIAWSSQPLKCRLRVIGAEIKYKVWDAASSEPDVWTVEVEDTTYTAPGSVAFRSGVAASNTNTKPVVFSWDNITVTAIYPRMWGEVSSWPVKWSSTGANARTSIVAAGPLRRLNQGTKGIRGALARKYMSMGPLAYWPLDDGPYTTTGGNASVTDQAGFSITSVVDFSKVDGPPGAPAKLPQLAVGTDRLPSATAALSVKLKGNTGTSYTVDAVYQATKAETSSTVDYFPLSWKDDRGNEFRIIVYLDWSYSTINWVEVVSYSPGYSHTVRARLNLNTADGEWHHIRVEVTPTTLLLLLDDTWMTSSSFSGSTIVVGTMTSMYLWNNYKTAVDSASCGHVAVFKGVLLPTTYAAFTGYVGEAIGTRLARLATEDVIDIEFIDGGNTRALGAQRQAKLPDLLTDVHSADLGQLSERRNAFSLRYNSNSSMQNQTPLTLDYSTGVITDNGAFEPAIDDAMRWNDVTAERYKGSKYRVEVTTGPNSTQNPPIGIGAYDRGTYTTHVATDGLIPDIAYFIAMAGTRHELRWPAIPLNLARKIFTDNHTLSAAIANADIGTSILLDNLPVFVGDAQSEVLILGYTEVITSKRWDIAFVTTPYEPYRVPLVDGDERVSTGNDMVLLDAPGAADTTLLIGSLTASQRWGQTDDTYSSASYPVDVVIGREIISATACTELAKDAFARTVASGFGTATTGQAWTAVSGSAAYSVANPYGIIRPTSNGVACPAVLSLSYCYDMDVVCDINIPVLSASGLLRAGVICRYNDSTNYYYAAAMVGNTGTVILRIGKVVSGSAYSIADYSSTDLYTAGDTWKVRFAVYGTTLRAKTWPAGHREPSKWQIEIEDTGVAAGWYAGCYARNDGSTTTQNIQFTNLKSISPQALTVTRGALAIAHAKYEPIDVAQPIYLGF